MTDYESIRQRHIGALLERLDDQLAKVSWPAELLRHEQDQRLRGLVAHAVRGSAFHRSRLGPVDGEAITVDDLAVLPLMTKDDLIDRFEEIVVDPRVTKEVAEDHLASLDGDAYLFDELHVVATGGSSGRRAVVVWDWIGWVECLFSLGRRAMARPTKRDGAMASVAGGAPWHMSAAITTTFRNPMVEMHAIPAAASLPEIVGRLEEIQPVALQGYPTMLHRLALEARAGRLRINPEQVLSGSEALLPETRALLEETWGVIVENGYGSSEAGGAATACGQGPWMHLNEDLVIVEILDDEGRPVSVGQTGRIVLTNLMNKVMPIIRYDQGDRGRLLDVECPCGSGHRVLADLEGRTTEIFHFADGSQLHPTSLSRVLGGDRAVADYQVRQTDNGLEVDLVEAAAVDHAALGRALADAVISAGGPQIAVEVRSVDHIARAQSGKARRFIPLAAAAPALAGAAPPLR